MSAIGIFDSGIGGLTVFDALRRRLPKEDLLYFGDTAHLPYGSKTQEAVTRCSLEVVRYLAKRRIKALVIACNTASALAIEAIGRALDVPVLGVIHPGARAASSANRNGAVGVIGTEATINSGAYSAALKQYIPGVRITSAACPLFVPLVEEGWWAAAAAKLTARTYLAPLKKARVDALVLGCTHYPMLKGVLRQVMGPGVRLIDSAEETARETEDLLRSLKLLKTSGKGSQQFTVSDGPERFKLVARRLGIKTGAVAVHRFD